MSSLEEFTLLAELEALADAYFEREHAAGRIQLVWVERLQPSALNLVKQKKILPIPILIRLSDHSTHCHSRKFAFQRLCECVEESYRMN